MTTGSRDRHGASPAELQERIRAERRGTPFLLYRDADGRQVLLELAGDREEVSIGRREDSDVALRWDPQVSRLHAQVERSGDDWLVRDDGLSHNGTFVNGERLHGRRRLRDGDVIAVGRTVIAVHVPTGATASATRTNHDTGVVELSPAQRRVLVELCRPMAGGRYEAPASNRRIAEALHLSLDTVKGTLRQLFDAFALEGMAQNEKRATLARQALERGLVRRAEL